MKWIKKNIIALLLLLGYYLYDNAWMFFTSIDIKMLNEQWSFHHYIYKLGEYLFSPGLLPLIIIAYFLPKNTDSFIIVIGLIIIVFKGFIGKLLETIGYNIDFFNNYLCNDGYIWKTALPIFIIMTCFIGRYFGKRWKKFSGFTRYLYRL